MTDERDEDDWLHFELNDDEIAERTALREDIPDYLYTSLWGWIEDGFLEGGRAYARFDNKFARKCERTLRVRILFDKEGNHTLGSGVSAVRSAYLDQPVRDTWRLVNFLLLHHRAQGGELKTILHESGSVWTVEDHRGNGYLERRVPASVRSAAEYTFQLPNGGKRLAEAWGTVFGVDPDPSKGYWLAVKAVEAASRPVIIPNNDAGTLSHVIGELRSGTWDLPFMREHQQTATRDVLVSMLQMLWSGEYDRHDGIPNSPLPDDMTQEEAEAAVMLAATLVGWFATNKVAKP